MIAFRPATYTAIRTHEHDAVFIAWEDVREYLGRPHNGSAEDDQALIAALLDAGAQRWVGDADGWVDEAGWGLIGPSKTPVLDYLTPDEAAALTGTSASNWRNRAAAGQIYGAVKKGKQWLIPRASLTGRSRPSVGG